MVCQGVTVFSGGVLVFSGGVLVFSGGVLVFSGGVLVFSGGVLVFSGGVLVFSGGVLVVARWCGGAVVRCLVLSDFVLTYPGESLLWIARQTQNGAKTC